MKNREDLLKEIEDLKSKLIEIEGKAAPGNFDDSSKYNDLFNKTLNGVAVHKIICDENGKPVDYRFIEVNPAFEEHTGLVPSVRNDLSSVTGTS